MIKIDEKLLMRVSVLIVILIAVVTILIGLGNFTKLVATSLIVVFTVGWVIAWWRGNETKKSFGIIAGVALAWLGFFVWADTPPSTLTSEPASFVPNGTGRIAFEEQWEIYVMNADGTGKNPLTSNEYEVSFPAWSPDGEQIAFVLLQARYEIYVMNADGTNLTRLTNSLAASNLRPIWSPDGQRIAFLSDRDGFWEIYVMNADGANQTRLTHNYQNRWCTPAWSPDGQHLAFVSWRSDGSPEIYVANADGTDQIHLYRNTRSKYKLAGQAAWSPDGKQIAFPGKDGIYVMNANGTDRTRLTDLKPWSQSCNDLVWSPDGQHIAFTTGVNVWVMNADGTNQTQLTDYQPYPSKNYAEISHPIWSPDGKRIAYDAGVPRGLNVMDVDGTNQIHLGSGDWPTWAP
jgi:Tol biopolymer transport system component